MSHNVNIISPAEKLASGVYVLIIQSENQTSAYKIVVE
ncbi:MAG: hypothetical protein IPM77_08065 [Crocinitomicaceae bacterium]|nr:hypothetical protein [Crocinitomicaceae bacterium]